MPEESPDGESRLARPDVFSIEMPGIMTLSKLLTLAFVAMTPLAAAAETGSSTWVTSVARQGASDTFIAATAGGLLLRPSGVFSFPASAPDSLTKLYEHSNAVWTVASSADGNLIASVDYRGNLITFDSASKKVTSHENAFGRWCQASLMSSDDAQLVVGSESGTVFGWSIADSKVQATEEVSDHAITDLTQSPDGKLIAASDGAGTVHLLKWPTLQSIGKITVQIVPPAPSPEPVKPEVTPANDDAKEESSGKDQPKEKDAKAKKDDAGNAEAKVDPPKPQPAWCVKFTDNNTLLIGSGDRHLYRSAAADGAQVKVVANGSDWITSLAVSPDGQVAASEVSGKVHFLSDDGVTTMQGPSGVWSLCWNGEGELLVGTRKSGVLSVSRNWKWNERKAQVADPKDRSHGE